MDKDRANHHRYHAIRGHYHLITFFFVAVISFDHIELLIIQKNCYIQYGIQAIQVGWAVLIYINILNTVLLMMVLLFQNII